MQVTTQPLTVFLDMVDQAAVMEPKLQQRQILTVHRAVMEAFMAEAQDVERIVPVTPLAVALSALPALAQFVSCGAAIAPSLITQQKFNF